MVHNLKILTEYFIPVISGAKPFEIRAEKDRKFEVGDILILREWSPEKERYTGARISKAVTYVLRDSEYVTPGYAVMGLKDY